MNCPKCKAAVRPGQRFCEVCGMQVDKTCSTCSALLPLHAMFCGTCGSPAPIDSDAPSMPGHLPVPRRESLSSDGERRQLTVLFADVVGATALSGKLDPEALRDVLRVYQGICIESVTRYGGNINQYIGDGVVAFFGHPIAHDNDAERAILAGLAIIAGISKLGQSLSIKREPAIEVRVGIHTGVVVVGAMGAGGGDLHHAIGETPNLAARIQGEAAPNSVCISAATLSLVGNRFQVRALGPRQLKGVAKDSELFSVVAAAASTMETRQGRAGGALVGREAELGHLIDRWELARCGQGQAVYLSGEGGIGKSRLLDALREYVTGGGHGWRTIRCSPFYQNSALYPIIDLIERAIGAAGEATPAARAASLRQDLRAAGIADDTSYVLIASLVGLDEHDRALSDMAPAQWKRQTLDTLIEWLRADAVRGPLVMVVEDLHWIDASTREFIAMVLERIAKLPVLVVLTYRPEFVPPWTIHANVSTIALARLTADEVVLVATGITSGKALPPRVVEEIVRRTDGVPLFVEELTKAILASGLILEREGVLQLASDQTAQLEVPATLRDSLTARLDRLGSAKEIAQLASVLGREFDFATLQSVCEIPAAELEAQLDALNRAEIIQQSGFPPHSHYVFKHALIQEAAYDTLLKRARQQLHERVASSYVERFAEVAQLRPELVAYHYSRALMPEVAVPFYQRAGELAVGRSAYEEAIAHLDAALLQLERVQDSMARSAMELGLRVKIGPALIARMGLQSPATASNYARACQLAETAGEPTERFMAMWGDWICKTTAGEIVAASRRSEDLVTLSRGLDSDDYVLQAHHSRWTNFFFIGDVGIARADTLQGIRLYDGIRHRHHKHTYGGHDPGVCAHGVGANAAWASGFSTEALRLAERAVSIGTELNHPFSLTSAYLWTALMLHNTRDYAATQATSELLIATCEKYGFGQWVGIGLVLSGASRVGQGDTAFGLKLVEDGLKANRTTLQLSLFPLVASAGAEAHLHAGDHVRALALLSEAIEVSDKTGMGLHRPEVQRLHAEAMLQSGSIRIEEAILRVGDAANRAKEQGAVALEWRASISLARLLERNRRPELARERLCEICDDLTIGLDSPELDSAKALLSALG